MREVQVRTAKASLSSLIEAAERGEPTTITRHGRPAAVLVSVAAAEKLLRHEPMNFGEFLLTFPGGVEFEREQTPVREIDL